MTIQINDDGLSQAYGRDQGGPAAGGEIGGVGEDRVMEIEVDFANLAAFGTEKRLGTLPTSALPTGALITEAYLDVDTAFTSGGSATLIVGLVEEDGTVVDADGLIASTALSALNAVGKHVTGSGALVRGTALAQKSFISATVGTANYTAGVARLIVKYRTK